MTKNKLLLLLALLMTAATGAWADEQSESFTTATTGTVTYTGEHFTITGQKADRDGLWITGKNNNMEGNPNTVTISSNNGENITRIEAVIGYKSYSWNCEVASTSGNVTGTYAVGKTITISSINATTVTLSSTLNDTPLIEFKSWTIYYGPAPVTYSVSLKDGVKDADKWTVKVGEGQAQALPIGGLKGDGSETVTLQYNGRLKVKGVKATSDAQPAWDGDLSKLTAESTAEFATVTDGMTIKGTLAEGVNVKISIADKATVTLDGVTINGEDDDSYTWAGINCLGDATIILKDGTENTVKGFHQNYPGIHVPENNTLTIQGSGSLTASSNGNGCGIGGGNNGFNCGNIVIADGTITANGSDGAAGIGSGGFGTGCGNISITGGTVNATGGNAAAGIGGGFNGSCVNISITGGTITATGGDDAAGIGGGSGGSCGNITITNGVTSVTATKGNDAPYSIGAGNNGSCGTVTIGGTVYWQDNAAVNGGDTYLATSPFIYLNLATVTEATTFGEGYTLTGTLGANVKISIAEGTTVTLDDVTINGANNNSYKWAGINCLGDATIILSGTNTVKGFYDEYPGIYVPQNNTLTIQGSGSLTASSNNFGCGIGGGYGIDCGNIVIAGGTITANGGIQAAGIGGGRSASCGTISITGGTVTAIGGNNAAGIGGGNMGSCGTVTITNGVTSVTATKGNNANYSIGAGNQGSCGTVTIGCSLDGDGNPEGGTTGQISDSTYTYQPSN